MTEWRARGAVSMVTVISALGASASPLAGQDGLRVRDLSEPFERFGATGTFVLVEEGAADTLVHDPSGARRGSLPASTFKILSSLIVLETGVLSGPEEVVPWDSVDRGSAGWNRDHDLASAFQASAVWVYQELVRRVGRERMEVWVRRADYGNGNLSGGVDRFWLDGGLRISPLEQVRFLGRLRRGELPFSRTTMRAVREIMVEEAGEGWVLRAKTGWARPELPRAPQVGWKVGWVEDRAGRARYFALRIETLDPDFPMRRAQAEISQALLVELGALPQP